MADKISITICGDGGCEDSYSVTRTVDGLPYFLSITDTAGQEEYRGLWTASTLKSDAFLLVYDITNPSSLATLDHFMEMINMEAEQRVEDNDRLRKELGPKGAGVQIGLPPPVKIVAGNKCDLKDGRAVTARDGLEYARKHGCGFMETSAREMVNIEETFALLVRRVVEARRLHDYQGTTPARRPPSRAGQSMHTTALPPVTAHASAKAAHEAQSRLSRFFGLGLSRKLAEPATSSKTGATESSKQEDLRTEKDEYQPRRSFFRRLCCGGCGCGCCR
ncbi:RAS small monomeric GTPase [Penicillium macrosclerotiorum]|uniref:RAS small monomeric GTPase n=1 Tax=Penicillium macrosclerotiorum TaxID=303699 RepID=UPI002547EDD8|nr:RAS small monomeric GTPase [Penicillium macrosclerotiorum]KAJ5692113.1 RAS small monomeric GTPase [Penicillium macrosclerotiorum]